MSNQAEEELLVYVNNKQQRPHQQVTFPYEQPPLDYTNNLSGLVRVGVIIGQDKHYLPQVQPSSNNLVQNTS